MLATFHPSSLKTSFLDNILLYKLRTYILDYEYINNFNELRLTVVLEKTRESLGLKGDPTSPFWRRSVLGFLWKEWCWSWNSGTLATSCEKLTNWKRLWCWKGLGAGGEGDDWGWDGWMASLTRWTWVWVNSGRWWWTGRPGMLRFMGLQRVGHDWVTELNWTEQLCSQILMESKQ